MLPKIFAVVTYLIFGSYFGQISSIASPIFFKAINIDAAKASHRLLRNASVTAAPKRLITNRPGGRFTKVPSDSLARQLLLEHIIQPMHKQQNSDDFPILVMAKLIPIKIQDLNEKKEILETTLRLQLTWQDRRLAWDPDAFNGVSEIIIPGDVIWSPDISVLNSVSDIYHVVRDTRFEMKVLRTGRVWWHPTGVVKTYCKLQLKYFPFDRQTCTIVLESPTLDLRFMNLTLRSVKQPVDTIMYIDGETWDLLGVSGHNRLNKVTSKTTFARVEFGIHLARARIYHLLNVILPAIFLSFVQVMFFLLPERHPQRVGSATTTLLSVVVFQSVVASQLPKTSTDVPILAIYIFIVTFISGISVCTSILLAKFVVFADSSYPFPRWLKNIPKITSIFTLCKRKRRRTKKNLQGTSNDECLQMPPFDDDDYSLFNNWLEFSAFFDRVLFAMAITIAVSSPIVLFMIIPNMVEVS